MTDEKRYTIVGTDIVAMQNQAQESGLTYNEAIAFIARTTGGRGTNVYSDTDIEAVKKQNEQSERMKE